MIFHELALKGAWLIDVETFVDERGSFGRTFCREEFSRHGLNPCVEQCNISHNRAKGTLRGMHFQAPPHTEAKLVRVTRGSLVDMIVDLRKESPTYLQHLAVPLHENRPQLLYVPERFGHGFQTLEDHTDVAYQMSAAYVPEATRGFRYDDPEIGIVWPLAHPILSPRDAAARAYHPAMLEPLP